jgi:hypothetical protein
MLSQRGGLLMPQRCSKGHWFDPDAPGALGSCPQCAIQTQSETLVTDDDVLAIMSMPDETPKPHDEPVKIASNSAIMRKKKICPECSHEASFSFDHCPRCGAPLKLARVELRNA